MALLGDEASFLTAPFSAAVVDAVAHPIFVKDRDFKFVVLNQALCAMVGYARDAMLGRTDYDFFPRPEADHFRSMDERVFATGETVVSEETITDASGQRHVLATTKVALRAPGGEVTHLVGIIDDITRRKDAEEALRLVNEDLERRVRERTAALEEIQGELVRRERLAVLGQLAGGLAHQYPEPARVDHQRRLRDSARAGAAAERGRVATARDHLRGGVAGEPHHHRPHRLRPRACARVAERRPRRARRSGARGVRDARVDPR